VLALSAVALCSAEDVSQRCLLVRVHKTYPGRILGFFNLDHSGSCQNLMECIHVIVESPCDAVGLDTLSQSFVRKIQNANQ
jgi:hypothetical protein